MLYIRWLPIYPIFVPVWVKRGINTVWCGGEHFQIFVKLCAVRVALTYKSVLDVSRAISIAIDSSHVSYPEYPEWIRVRASQMRERDGDTFYTCTKNTDRLTGRMWEHRTTSWRGLAWIPTTRSRSLLAGVLCVVFNDIPCGRINQTTAYSCIHTYRENRPPTWLHLKYIWYMCRLSPGTYTHLSFSTHNAETQ